MKHVVLLAVPALLMAAALVYLLPSDSPERSQAEARIEIDGFRLTLAAREGTCHLDFSKEQDTGSVPLRVEPPCRFMRADGGGVLFSAEDGRRLVAIVGGTPEDDPIDPLTRRADCGTAIAGVELSGGSFTATSYLIGPGVYCALMGLEGREIWLLLNG
ncbi:hypothetical protein [Roseibium sediminicola]|uniref:Protease inhibitor Inh n=1 Tax=Roseibium sediminicola TaxID=2933272 RepID=A0ABT0GZI5_9HYPH|nr:hypothetical protein [Roseibium sp. CAU 1639]MCK7614836.1 hypothetical protein [Roseibium sp. CAU 1639]